MSSDLQAKLFYGFIQPLDDREAHYQDMEETPWTQTHTRKAHGCLGGIYGTDEAIGHYLAVEGSHRTAQWSTIVALNQKELQVEDYWDAQLEDAVKHFNLNVTGQSPSWYLVSLYF